MQLITTNVTYVKQYLMLYNKSLKIFTVVLNSINAYNKNWNSFTVTKNDIEKKV